MSTQLLEPKTESPDNTTDDDVAHLFCHCDDRFTLCGMYVEEGKPEYDEIDDDEICEDCLIMDKMRCIRCGCFVH